ncbi:MAG TPA: phenylalanine--tRNA ligase subunit beta [Acidobacteriaceae bacterium]|nr:phenylalanine--tRNA ligase subunit beta [Acidobacteriaceae bacterium]
MKILSNWLRSYVPGLPAADRELAEALTLRGIAVEGVFDLGPGNGSLFEMDITTNRVDAMNHYGIAREAAAIYSLPLSPLEAVLGAPVPTATPVKVVIEAKDLCGRFTARALTGVRIQPSTGIVQQRFRLLEQKAISNAVDATNYVTLAMGHPTHAFDRDKLQGAMVIRRARKGEKLTTLDGIERVLDPEDLVVADESRALAIAGVMGGWDTMITEETTNVLVEAAWFDPLSIRRSSKRHGLHTDASHRFERGADFNAPPVASALVCSLLLSSGGALEGGLVDVVVPEAAARTALRPGIELDHREVRRILGATEDGRGIEPETSEAVLRSLGCSLSRLGEETCAVSLPSWRLDLEREIDLIEEIARVYGYNRFANTLPVFSGAVAELPQVGKESAVRRSLLAMGWSEAVSSTFCSATDADTFSPLPGLAVPLGNPLNEEAGVLRPSLVPGMLTMLGNNLNRNVMNVQLFEIGTSFSGNPDRVEERPALALGAVGSISSGPHLPAHSLDFYDLKGALEELLKKFSIRSLYFDRFSADSGLMPAWLHPLRAARAVADGSTVAWFGQLHPEEAQRRKLRQTVYAAEVYLDRLYRLPLRQPIAREISRFQPVQRDFSFLFPERVQWQQIADALENLHLSDMTRFAPQEIFRGSGAKTGAGLPAGHSSILISVTFQSLERTLRDEELQSYSQLVTGALESLGGRQRG